MLLVKGSICEIPFDPQDPILDLMVDAREHRSGKRTFIHIFRPNGIQLGPVYDIKIIAIDAELRVGLSISKT